MQCSDEASSHLLLQASCAWVHGCGGHGCLLPLRGSNLTRRDVTSSRLGWHLHSRAMGDKYSLSLFPFVRGSADGSSDFSFFLFLRKRRLGHLLDTYDPVSCTVTSRQLWQAKSTHVLPQNCIIPNHCITHIPWVAFILWVAAQAAVRWPGIPMVACSRPRGCSKSGDLWLAFAPCNMWSSRCIILFWVKGNRESIEFTVSDAVVRS